MIEVAVGLLEHAAHHRERLGRGHAQAVDRLLLHAGGRELGIELRARAVHDDRRQADVLQEGERRGERLEVVAQHRPAHLHYGEALGIEL
jgi:hypothetical protein